MNKTNWCFEAVLELLEEWESQGELRRDDEDGFKFHSSNENLKELGNENSFKELEMYIQNLKTVDMVNEDLLSFMEVRPKPQALIEQFKEIKKDFLRFINDYETKKAR